MPYFCSLEAIILLDFKLKADRHMAKIFPFENSAKFSMPRFTRFVYGHFIAYFIALLQRCDKKNAQLLEMFMRNTC